MELGSSSSSLLESNVELELLDGVDRTRKEQQQLDRKSDTLEWKEFFGSSVSLAPSLISIFDRQASTISDDVLVSQTETQSTDLIANQDRRFSTNHVTDCIPNVTDHEMQNSLFILKENNNTASQLSVVVVTSSDSSTDSNCCGEGRNIGRSSPPEFDARKRPLSIRSNCSCASISIIQHRRKKFATGQDPPAHFPQHAHTVLSSQVSSPISPCSQQYDRCSCIDYRCKNNGAMNPEREVRQSHSTAASDSRSIPLGTKSLGIVSRSNGGTPPPQKERSVPPPLERTAVPAVEETSMLIEAETVVEESEVYRQWNKVYSLRDNVLTTDDNDELTSRSVGSVSASSALFGSTTSGVVASSQQIDRVVTEIVETERNFVLDLKDVIQGYMETVRNIPQLISSSDIVVLFGNIDQIYAFNCKFLAELEDCETNPIKVAGCFVRNSSGFSIYSDYCTNYPKSMEVLSRCLRSDRTADVLRSEQMKLGHGLPLGSYLLKPVQRILKYHVLLQNMLNDFGQSRSGYDVIEQAQNSMMNVALSINELKREHERSLRTEEIQGLLCDCTGTDIAALGELVLEDKFQIHGAKASRHLLLFRKALLVAKRRDDGLLQIKASLMGSHLMLMETVQKMPLSFHLIAYNTPRLQFTVQAGNQDQKRIWCQEIKRVIVENYLAVIPDKAKQLAMKCGQTYVVAGAENTVENSKKASNVSNFVEKTRNRRRSAGSLTGKKVLDATVSSPPPSSVEKEKGRRTKNRAHDGSRSLQNIHSLTTSTSNHHLIMKHLNAAAAPNNDSVSQNSASSRESHNNHQDFVPGNSRFSNRAPSPPTASGARRYIDVPGHDVNNESDILGPWIRMNSHLSGVNGNFSQMEMESTTTNTRRSDASMGNVVFLDRMAYLVSDRPPSIRNVKELNQWITRLCTPPRGEFCQQNEDINQEMIREWKERERNSTRYATPLRTSAQDDFDVERLKDELVSRGNGLRAGSTTDDCSGQNDSSSRSYRDRKLNANTGSENELGSENPRSCGGTESRMPRDCNPSLTYNSMKRSISVKDQFLNSIRSNCSSPALRTKTKRSGSFHGNMCHSTKWSGDQQTDHPLSPKSPVDSIKDTFRHWTGKWTARRSRSSDVHRIHRDISTSHLVKDAVMKPETNISETKNAPQRFFLHIARASFRKIRTSKKQTEDCASSGEAVQLHSPRSGPSLKGVPVPMNNRLVRSIGDFPSAQQRNVDFDVTTHVNDTVSESSDYPSCHTFADCLCKIDADRMLVLCDQHRKSIHTAQCNISDSSSCSSSAGSETRLEIIEPRLTDNTFCQAQLVNHVLAFINGIHSDASKSLHPLSQSTNTNVVSSRVDLKLSNGTNLSSRLQDLVNKGRNIKKPTNIRLEISDGNGGTKIATICLDRYLNGQYVPYIDESESENDCVK